MLPDLSNLNHEVVKTGVVAKDQKEWLRIKYGRDWWKTDKEQRVEEAGRALSSVAPPERKRATPSKPSPIMDMLDDDSFIEIVAKALEKDGKPDCGTLASLLRVSKLRGPQAVEAAAQIAGKSLGLNSPDDGTWWGRTWMERLKIWCEDKIFLETELPQLYFNDLQGRHTKSIMQITNGGDFLSLDYDPNEERQMNVYLATCRIFYRVQTPMNGTWPNIHDSNGNEHPVVPFFKRCIRIFTSPPFNMKFERKWGAARGEAIKQIADKFEKLKYTFKLPKNVTQDPNDTEEDRKRKEENAQREYMQDALKNVNVIVRPEDYNSAFISFVYPQFWTDVELQAELRDEIKYADGVPFEPDYDALMAMFPSTPPFWHDLFQRANDAGRIHNSYPEVVNEDVPVSF
jgi:hypothetical protein